MSRLSQLRFALDNIECEYLSYSHDNDYKEYLINCYKNVVNLIIETSCQLSGDNTPLVDKLVDSDDLRRCELFSLSTEKTLIKIRSFI